MDKTINTIEAMHAEGITIASGLHPTDIVTLAGELGAGKTTLTKGILSYFGIDPKDVTSPTFSIMNIYHAAEHNESIKQLVHIDTYRLEDPEELLEIGFEEYISDPETITIIEWPEKVEHILSSVSNRMRRYALEHTEDGRILKSAA